MSERFQPSMVTHGTAEIEPGLCLHYVSAGTGERVVVLLHGFPQTWWAWRYVISILSESGFRVIAPDYRGAGNSTRPVNGYDKRTMAGDVHRLLTLHLGIEGPVVMVGHDIGLMVAYAYAESYRDDVSHLVVMDAPMPGTTLFDSLRNDPRAWHFAFHGARDVPEMLVAGRERQYLQHIFHSRISDSSAISDTDLDFYTTAYSVPGALRAGFELYRAFDQDVAENREALKEYGKLQIPVLAVYGSSSQAGPRVEEMMHELSNDVQGLRIPAAGHWIAEENPAFFVEGLLGFLGQH